MLRLLRLCPQLNIVDFRSLTCKEKGTFEATVSEITNPHPFDGVTTASQKTVIINMRRLYYSVNPSVGKEPLQTEKQLSSFEPLDTHIYLLDIKHLRFCIKSRCCLQAASSVLYTTSCKHSLVLLRMGEIIFRNMLSWLKLLIKLSLLHLVGCLFYYINDARSHKHQK